MSTKIKNTLVFSLSILLATGVYIWFYPMNKGTLNITTNVSEYIITTREKTIQCQKNPCLIPLKSGIHKLTLNKDDYFEQAQSTIIRRGKQEKLIITLKKIPSLKISTETPPNINKISQKLPNKLNNKQIQSPTWDQDEKQIAYIDRNDDKLKIWKNNNSKIIASLKNISKNFKLYWSPNQMYLFGVDNNAIYFIDILKATRKKSILNLSPQNSKWSLDNNYLLLNNKNNKLYKINISGNEILSLEVEINLENSKWKEYNNLVYYANNIETNSSTIALFNTITQTNEMIMSKTEFSIDKISTNNDIIYFHNPSLSTWYKLDF